MSSSLTDNVREALLPPPAGLTLVITVGNSLRTDDGVGPYIASRVGTPREGICLLDVADRPEDGIDEAVEKRPAKTVMIDAADFGGRPGEARIIPPELIPDTTLSTHTFPLKIITKILEEETGSDVFFLGIQPESVSFGEGLSPEVEKTAVEIIRLMSEGEDYA